MKKRTLLSESVVYSLSLNFHGKTFWYNHRHGMIFWSTNSDSTVSSDKKDLLWSKKFIARMTNATVCYEDDLSQADMGSVKMVKITRRRYAK